jgi:hypothetical protein
MADCILPTVVGAYSSCQSASSTTAVSDGTNCSWIEENGFSCNSVSSLCDNGDFPDFVDPECSANFYVSNASWPLIICEPGLDDSSELWEPRSSGYLRQVLQFVTQDLGLPRWTLTCVQTEAEVRTFVQDNTALMGLGVRYSSNVTDVTLSTPVFYSGYSLISLRKAEKIIDLFTPLDYSTWFVMICMIFFLGCHSMENRRLTFTKAS